MSKDLWSRIVRHKGGQPKSHDRKYLLHIVGEEGRTGCGRGLKKMPPRGLRGNDELTSAG